MGDTDTPTGTDITPLVESKEISEIFRNPSSAQEALLSVFDLQESHVRAYIAVVEHPDSKIDRIAEVVDRHRRYVAKSLRALHDAGLVEREERTFETGSIGLVYSPLPPEEVESRFQNELRDWLIDAQTEIRKIDRRIEVDSDSLCCDHGDEN
ncbi:helix-turn-helix domain-containing protein [Halococcus salifodinae]|uniref:TrmB family transcriptional regulator n=1 Tax=Halococcus salifodinae DSM 8989 TaxID=1227456 RepID=M0NB34_9EURY|nr:helix-turn-helix domain-containing protein [Halococcus salifodinae]EMA54783.1 TrmB family transcriptional regulator [Halococcus salifodinae DSM 8989]